MKHSDIFKGLGFATLAGLLFTACGPSAGYDTAGEVNAIVEKPDGTFFIVEENDSGESTTMHLEEVFFGRLVDEVYDDTSLTPLHTNLVIGQDIESDGVDFLLESNPISGFTTLTILHMRGTPEYDSAFDQLFANMEPVMDKGVAQNVLPPFTMIPRNAALSVRFSDLLDVSSITEDTVQVAIGYPPTTSFPVRLLPDPNHGALVDGEFVPTRVVIDPVVSVLDAQQTTVPVNNIGYPAALTTGAPNMALRLPTQLDFEAGQFVLLQNLAGNPLKGLENQLFDFDSPTVDVVRALRTGGTTNKLDDPNNGFLPDEVQPQVIGRQPILIDSVTPGPTDGTFELDLTFTNALCASEPQVGDVIEQPGVFLEVTADGSSAAGVVSDLMVRTLTDGSGVPFQGGGHYETPWGLIDKAPAPCFVEFDPPGVTGASNVTNVDPFANVIVRFSEPMDPALMNPYDAFTIGNQDIPLEDMNIGSFQVGEVLTSADARDFRFVQTVPFRHIAGNAEDFFVSLNEQAGVVDLAGNDLAINFPTVEFLIEPSAATQRTTGKSFRFANFFEEENVGKFIDDDRNGEQDLRGQIVWDLTRQIIAPRPVDRFSQTIDRNQGVPGWMTANASTLTGGLLGTAQEPLNPLGCKLMHLWRYFDMGLDVVDEAFTNIDVEHVNWAPIGQNVQAEFFPQFQMSLATTNALPDESFVTPPNTLSFPGSGLATTSFDENILLDSNNPLTIVHDKEEGYFIDPSKKFKSLSDTFLFPYPMNKNKPADEFEYWTYRDTAITALGGKDPDVGLEPPVRFDLTAIPSIGSAEFTFIAGDPEATPPIEGVEPNLIVPNGLQIPSFGLPILLEFRCYSSDETVGINRLDTSLAIGPVWAAGATPQNALNVIPRNPVFRVFSAGGIDASEKIVYKDPDLEVVPSGGFHYEANTIAPKGAPTGGSDTYFYMGQLDFVVRVSRAHTIWHQIPDGNPIYFEPVLEPSNADQPQGTEVQIALRGATNNGNTESRSDATTLNMYGDKLDAGDPLTFYGGPYNDGIAGLTDWTEDVTDMEGLPFFQVRMTFVNNPAAGTSPELSTLALAFQGQ